MNRFSIHNGRENRIFGYLKALRPESPDFHSVAVTATLVIALLILSYAFIQNDAKNVESKRAADISFGVEKSVNVFAGKVESKGWSNDSAALTQDLGEQALYQDFTIVNAAYVVGNHTPPETQSPADAPSVPSTDTANDIPTSEPPAETPASETEPEPEPVQEVEAPPVTDPEPQPEPISEPNAEAPVSVLFGVQEFATHVYPLAQLTLTSSTEPEAVLNIDMAPTEFESVVETTPELLPDDETAVASSTASSSVISNIAAPLSGEHDLVLSEFGTLKLEPGQFVNAMQVRLSFGGAMKQVVGEQAPYIEVLYENPGQPETENQNRPDKIKADGKADEVRKKQKEEIRSVGVILLDEETSNAINGGYYLFALPIETIADIETARVTLRLHGDASLLDGLYLDAAWVEVDTKIITKEDLMNRGIAEKLTHLSPPTLSVLLSDQLNFGRHEKPIFNLRYESQRNFLVRGFRSLLGRDLVKVKEIKVNHRSFGFIGIDSNVSITKDGLVSLEIPESQLVKMRPGTYTIEITYDEGGKTFTDTFDFEWGILSINPLQSEYSVGDTANIDIGALTPNGHTMCGATLDLYITDPGGYITRLPVEPSGECEGNNVTDIADFSASTPVTLAGQYELYLERLDEAGNVIGFTTDTFNASADPLYTIARDGPTRIYPVAPYEMELTVRAKSGFSGTVTERVPAAFTISSTSADIRRDGDWQILSWDVDLQAGSARTLSYGFDAPDLSPFLFNVGPAMIETGRTTREVEVASTTASSTEIIKESSDGREVFKEHRQWQIASDAVGNMILYWDSATSIPTGWTCLSCGSGTFYQQFAMGSSTYNTTGGATTHTHTAAGSINVTSSANTENGGTGGVPIVTHTHTYTPTINSVSNLPSYRQLRVIQYTAAAGEPATLPTGAIGIFDAAVPTGWTRYSAQDGYYIRGENTPGTTGGANTHTHTITGTTGAAAGTSYQARGGGTQVTGASLTHTHTISSNTLSNDNEPPFINVILGKLNATSSPPNGLITMWTDDVDGGWQDVSSSPSDPFSNRFLKASASYGANGGTSSHTPDDITGITTAVPSATTNARLGASGADGAHTHSVSVTGFSTTSHLPPYLTVTYGKRLGTSAVYTQFSSRWYVNENTITPTDAWPSGGTDLAERANITASTIPIKDGERVRLRINAKVTNATSTAGAAFKLQYAAASTCSSATGWTDVGSATSSVIWRGYNNTSVTDDSTLSSNVLGSSTVSQTYQENGYDLSTPNNISVNGYGEWDFVLQHNGAAEGTNYCFRMIQNDGTVFSTYAHYPQLFTNEAPVAPVLTTPFDNEKVASSTPWFHFYATDPESNKVHYQIQIDDTYSFASPVHDLDTQNTSEDDYFENRILISDKAAFIQGDLIRVIPPSSLSNGTTYYWRVRAQDPDGSTDWGDWSTVQSLTVDTAVTASTWYQTENEQFTSNTRSGVQAAAGSVSLITGSSSGTMTSAAIDFDNGENGTAWGSFSFNDTETVGDLKYQLQYLNASDVWTTIPDSALAGNSAGFDTSPVSLLNLDTITYNRIRLVANFTNSGGSPSLQNWTVSWDYRVEIPTITMPFANEQVSTTTPTFEFSTTDPQNNSLTYQISWSTTPDFTASTTRTSGVAAGFTNIDFGGDTDPFISGDTIQYQIQAADALASSTTYWWRVRAKDTTGANAYSFWTAAQSFTVIPGTQVSTWFQTTEEQFDTNILSGTRALANDTLAVATTAAEAIIVYPDGTNTAPAYRLWDGSSWSSASTLLDVGSSLRWVVVRAGITREEYVAATVGSDGDVNVQVYGTGAWGNLREMTTNVGNVAARGFDVAYETTSGDAIVVYCDGDADPSYYVWNGTSWTSGGTINLASTNNCEWIKLASDPAGDEIILMARDSDGTGAASYELQVWNGSSWGNSTTQGGAKAAAYETMALEYEDSGGQALSVTNDGNPARFEFNSWNGSAWAGLGTNTTISDNLIWAELSRDDGSDNLSMCYVDETVNIGVIRWTGAAWTGITNLDVTGNAITDRSVSCSFETTTGRDGYIMAVYSDTTDARYRSFNGATWAAEATITGVGDSATIQTRRTGVGTILAAFYDDATDRLDFSSWNGSSWSTAQTLSSDMPLTTAPFGEPFMIGVRNEGRAGTTVVSPAIDFNEGSGPYWQRFSWSDTTPGTSNILYHLQYQNASGTWAFIPDAALSGNVAGFTNSPIDLTGLNTNTYNVIRPYAALSCDATNCPTLSDWKVEWAGGINLSGTIRQYDESTNVTSGTVAVAVNGVLQTGKTGSISGGNWTISNVTAFEGDVITVFVTGAGNSNEAVGVTRYDGQGDVTGMTLFERHLTLGSNDATTTPLTNSDLGYYDYTNNEDLFFNVTTGSLTMCADSGCADATLYIKAGTYYTPGGRFLTHDFENNGIFTAGSFTHEINGSWDNNATTTMTGSTVVFAATSTTESIDNTGAPTIGFNHVTLGTSTGNGTFTLGSTLDVNGNLTVTRGTFARASTPITIAGNLSNEANGVWTGTGTTTFDGSSAATWRDQNATLQDVGKVVVDGTSKFVTLAGNVKAQTVTIGANDTLDASTSHYDITVMGSWNNQNNFVSRSGEVFFAATTSSRTITTTGDNFYDLTFLGSGSWSFTETTVNVSNDLKVTAGTVTLPTATTTVAGSFTVTGGNFAHNNGVLYFTSGSAETITFLGGAFTNVARNLTFNGAGNWTVTDTNATSTNDVRVIQGTLNFPTGTFAIGGTLIDAGGVFYGGTGTVAFYSTASKVITMGGSALNNAMFNGTGGSWSFSDTNATISGNLVVQQGTVTLPSGTLLIGGSYDNNAAVTPGTGTVEFNAVTSGHTLDFGVSPLYNVVFNSGSGGWTIIANATTTNNLTLTNVNTWTLDSGRILSVGATFTNVANGAATTWTGSTLVLQSGTYSLNTKSSTGDSYDTLAIAANTKISMWKSVASTYTVNSTGSLYSQDHNNVDGDLYIFGAYTKSGGNEYWSYATDFDGTALGTTSRQVDVRFASGASASFSGTAFNITGTAAASTSIANQGSGTYTVSLTNGTLSAGYYDFDNLGGGGLSLLGTVTVPTLDNGSFTVGAAAASALTISSTTINANPSKQILGVRFATTSAIAATNVTQSDGAPTSFWWFKNGYGNLYGEAKDNDTGNPGSIRFDDSLLVITISGTVYSDAGVTPLVGGTCDGSTQSVKVVVNGGTSYTGSCSNVDGSYSIGGIVISGDPTVTVFLDNASGGQKGAVITRTPTANITNMDIYANRVMTRHEDIAPLTIANLAVYDVDNDADLRFSAATTSGNTMTVLAGNELFVHATSTFTPGGAVTLAANAGANSYDGTLYVDNGATFNAYSSSTLTIGGRLVVDPSATFNAASTTVLMNATTSGKSVTATNPLTFHTLTFNGSGGSWNLGANITVSSNMNITAGTVTGTGNITLPNGSLSGNGVLSLGAGTTTINQTNTLGGTSAWTFYNLKLGSGTVVGTTTPVSSATTTIAGRLTIATAHFLDAGSSKWDLSGTGTVFVEQGTLREGSSTFRYSGAGANVLSTGYYNLDINAGAGSQTYTATGLGIIVGNNLTIGGTSGSTFNVTTSDPALDVNGSVTIRNNGTMSASDSNVFTVGGSYTNTGTFTSNNGTTTFDGAGTVTIAAGNSSFGKVVVNGAGTYTLTQNATSTGAFRLMNAGGFTLNSGQTLAVGGTFFNAASGGNTTWTGSTLRLSGNGNYTINPATSTDTYGTLTVKDTTQVRLWNSDASSYAIDSGASLYSQDHANVAGDLNIYGSYRKTAGSDYWSYATDFDGTALGGSSRKVDVSFASGASALYTGGSLQVAGSASASTTLQNQGSGTYAITIGGTASTSWQYYEVTDTNSSGLVLTGSPTVASLSYGSFEVSQNGGSGLTVGGTVINTNPAKNFTLNRFFLNGVGSGFGVTATGTTISAWRFANHYGDIDGEANDVDPGGDPGYIGWDDSAALITISGRVYSDEGTTVSGVCDGSTNNITLRVAGITTYSTSCNATTGLYSISNVSYGSTDSLVVYIDGETEKAAAVSKEPVSNINDLSLYENRVIVRHESINPINIDNMAVWDSSDDADIPFTAVSGSPDTLTLPANRKLIVWSAKAFAPGGTVTLSGGGAGAAYDGTLELYSNADWNGAGTDALSVGGSLILNAGADFTTSNGTTTFTTTGAARTIDLNQDALHNVAFTGSGSWTISDVTFTANGNVSQSAGALTLPTGTSTFNGSLISTGGTINSNNGIQRFTGTGGKVLRTNGSSLGTVQFAGGNYIMTDVNATSTGSTTIQSGTITLPSGSFSVGGDFVNLGGAITHNTSDLILRSSVPAVLRASSSDLFSVRFAGTGTYTMTDTGITFADNFTVNSGASVTLASGTIAVGGSLAAPGTFTNSTTTFLFNASASGKTINPGNNSFYAVQVSAPAGGYTLTSNATTTHNFTLTSVLSFVQQSATTLTVNGVFTNLVGGTNTSWDGTLNLNGANAYTLNAKATPVERYNTLIVGGNSDLRMWNSSATTTTVAASASLYSQDHAAVNGYLYVYGDFHIGTSTEYWNYAKDFDGTNLTGSEREVNVFMAQNSTTTVDGGTLQILGVSGFETNITNQGAGTFAFDVSSGVLNAQYYSLRNLNSSGLNLTGTPTITALSYGDFELAVNNGSLISVASSTINANASKIITGTRFATTSAITGKNVTLSGTTANVWTFTTHTGNLDGEAFDIDGISACGSLRWSDSSCLITQQTHYRWRNDDGGAGVPGSEWFNTNWDSRKSVRVDNVDASSYNNAAVQLFVTYDSDMQADFDDIRFTSDDGVTALPYWVGSSTDNERAEVWVKVPTLPAEGTATLYMYYNNPGVTSSSSAEDTFEAADDFEDDDITEYSGQTSLFNAGPAFAYDGDYGLDNDNNESGRANTGGIYRLDQTVSQGQTFRYVQYIDASATGDEVCTKFGIQAPGSANDNYAVCVELPGTDRLVLVKDAVENDSNGGATTLDSENITVSSGWYIIEVQWGTDDTFVVTMTEEATNTVAATLSATDGTYTSGGIGFTYWFNQGGWDSVHSRPTLTTEPTIRFGAEQGDGGATWKSAQDTLGLYNLNDIARLRVAIENSGLQITNQQLLLEYAALGAAPSCEAVDSGDFVPVPVQASCGSSPVCMQSSSFITNGATIADHLYDTNGTYILGQVREDPSNITSAMTINQGEYTEIEYALTPTINTIDQNLCFRVTNNGAEFDTYLSIAHLRLRFAPAFSTPSLNSGFDISLLPGTTTRVYATGTVTDLNGYNDITYATSTFYRSGASGGAACTPNNNDCYRSSCTFTNCSGNNCTASCYADIFFHADPTDAGSPYDGQEWFAFMEVEDSNDDYDFDTSPGVAMSTLRAIDVNNAITYASVAVNTDTGANNASTTVENEGNVEVNLEVEGTDMSDGNSSIIPANQQKFATSTFTYGTCTSCASLSNAIPFELDVDLTKPTTASPPVADNIYWGVAVPYGTNSTPHTGINVFTPVSP